MVKLPPPPKKQDIKAKQKPSGPVAPPPSNPAVIEAQYQPAPYVSALVTVFKWNTLFPKMV